MKQKNLFIVIVVLLCVDFIAGCNSMGKDAFTVTVNYKNLDKMPPQYLGQEQGTNVPVKTNALPRIMLQEIPYGGDMNPVIIDSATLSGSAGKVVLEGKAVEETIFQ